MKHSKSRWYFLEDISSFHSTFNIISTLSSNWTFSITVLSIWTLYLFMFAQSLNLCHCLYCFKFCKITFSLIRNSIARRHLRSNFCDGELSASSRLYTGASPVISLQQRLNIFDQRLNIMIFNKISTKLVPGLRFFFRYWRWHQLPTMVDNVTRLDFAKI